MLDNPTPPSQLIRCQITNCRIIESSYITNYSFRPINYPLKPVRLRNVGLLGVGLLNIHCSPVLWLTHLCALCTLAAGDLGDLDLDSLLSPVTSELYLSGLLLSLTTLTVLEVINVEDWQSSCLSSEWIVTSSRLAEATRSLAFLWMERETSQFLDK